MSDLLIRDARLVPVSDDERAPDGPVDVLVRAGLVIEVGEALTRPAGVPDVRAEGRWLIPGLWDQHVHLGQWTLARQRFDTTGATSSEDLLQRVAERVHEQPGRPVIGVGHRPGSWKRHGTVAELDEVTGVTPVVLIAGDFHHAWLNSAALAALGLPPRDPAMGEETVRENEWFAAYGLLTGLGHTVDDSPSAYRESLEVAASRGVVGVVDLEFVGGVDEWIERWLDGCDLLRVRVGVYAESLDDVVRRGLRTGDRLVGGDRLTMGPLKIISDGSINTRTAWCHDPYSDADELTHPHGAANLTEHELVHLMARAHVAGLEVATHAIGDAALGAALDAYAATGATGSIEHVQLATPTDLMRIADLDLRASVQPAHILDDRDISEAVWPGRAADCFALRTMLGLGVRTVFGSDAPVSPLDPWLAVAAAVHRTADDRPAWTPEERVTPRQALAASVDGQPMIGRGSRGDLVLVDHDPLDVPVDWATRESPTPTAALTVVDGRVVHSNIGSSSSPA